MNNISNPTGEKQTKKVKSKRRSVKLDEVLKLLFSVSKKMLIDTLNGLFNETFNPDSVDINISKTASEFVSNNLDIIRGDMFLKVLDGLKPHNYHIEYQTSTAGDMVIRMFEYDIQKALDNRRVVEGDNNGRITLYMPKSIVIHFEDSRTIPDKYTLDIVFANGVIQEYTVDVMKYWQYDDKKLIEKGLYNLLPLQVFLLRSELDKTTKSKDKQAQQTAILKAKNITEQIANEIMTLSDEKKINSDDVDKIMIALNELFSHLNERYNGDKKLSEEVFDMVKTMLDKNLLKRVKEAEAKIIETAKKMLLNNEPTNKIIDYTGLTESEITNIAKTLTDKK